MSQKRRAALVAAIIEQEKDDIAVLCRAYRIRTLLVFGSAVTDAFDPERSDIDFQVYLGAYDEDIVRRYVGLANELEMVLARDVDLVSVGGVTKPRFREEVERTRVLVYGRATP